MNDTVTKLMGMVDEYMIQERDGTNGREVRQALQDELVRLFTPLTDEHVNGVLRSASPEWLEETDCWSFKCGIKFAEVQRGITGEKNEAA